MLLRNQLYAGIVDVPGVRGKRAHPDFPLGGFVRCESCGRGLTGSSKSRAVSRFEVTFRKGSARAGLQVAFEADGTLFIRELDDDVRMWIRVSEHVQESLFMRHAPLTAHTECRLAESKLTRIRRDAGGAW